FRSFPPHDGAGNEHNRRRESGESPSQLYSLVAKAWAVAGNTDPIDAAEVQIGEPIDNLINDAISRIGVGDGFDAVRDVLKPRGVAQVRSAQSKQQDDAEGPEADHAMQIPSEALPPDIPANKQ